MNLKDLEKELGYMIKDNYILKETDSFHYKIRLLFPYGICNKDLLVYPYISTILSILDAFFTYPNAIIYDVGPNYTIINIDVFDLYNVPKVLATIFNFLYTYEPEKLFEKDENNETLFERFKTGCEANYHDNIHEFLKVDGKDVSDYLYDEWAFINNAKEDDIIKKIKATKELIQEETALVFLQGKNITNPKMNWNGIPNVTFERKGKLSYNTKNKYLMAPESYYIEGKYKDQDTYKDEMYYHAFLFGYLKRLFPTSYLLNAVPLHSLMYFQIDYNEYGRYLKDTEFLIKNLMNSQVEETFYEHKRNFLLEMCDYYERTKNDVDAAIEVFLNSGVYYNENDVNIIIKVITEYTFSEFLKDIVKTLHGLGNNRFIVPNEKIDGIN